MYALDQLFTWVLELQTQVFVPVQQALYGRSHPFCPFPQLTLLGLKSAETRLASVARALSTVLKYPLTGVPALSF